MIRAKKSLGQNFLKNNKVLDTIVQTSDVQNMDTVLEIGPGKGALTEKLLATGATVIAIEKDNRLIPVLQEKFADYITKEKLQLIEGDALEIDYSRLNLELGAFKIVANIPYYITGQFLRKSLENDIQPSLITLMIQKEVAQRIVARDNKESLLSLSVKAYGEPKYIQTVPARDFSPAPKIDSAILMINGISKSRFTENNITEQEFFSVLKAGFASKRKQLQKNLKNVVDREVLGQYFIQEEIDPQVRGEDLSINQWMKLAAIISKKI